MGFLKKIFKKKAGGTKIGNLIRGVASKVSGGKLGQGKHMIQKPESEMQDDQPQDMMIKIGSTVGNFANETLTPVITKALTGTATTSSTNLLSAVTDPLAESAMDSLWATLKKRWYLILIPFGLIIIAIIYAVKSKNKRNFRR